MPKDKLSSVHALYNPFSQTSSNNPRIWACHLIQISILSHSSLAQSSWLMNLWERSLKCLWNAWPPFHWRSKVHEGYSLLCSTSTVASSKPQKGQEGICVSSPSLAHLSFPTAHSSQGSIDQKGNTGGLSSNAKRPSVYWSNHPVDQSLLFEGMVGRCWWRCWSLAYVSKFFCPF